MGGEARLDKRFKVLASILACSMARNDRKTIERLYAYALDEDVLKAARPKRMKREQMEANMARIDKCLKGAKKR